jgi:hypothetical protein
MRKCLVVLVAALAVVAFSMPAMGADLKASGFYRAYGILSNFHDGGGGPSLRTSGNEQTNAFVAQRFRVKWTFGNENVKAVWYLESDMIWGDSAGSTDGNGGAGRNIGGALGADKIQTETKQINVWFKSPDTSVEATVGLHTIKDDFSGVFNAANDAAGVTITGKYEPVAYKIVWAKAYENVTNHADDGDLYQAEVEWGPSKETKLGFDFYFWKDTTAKGTPRLLLGDSFPINDYKMDIYMPGISGSMKAGPVMLSGWFFYQFGTFESIAGAPDVDISGFAINARGDMNLGPGKFFIEGLYITGDDNENDDKYKSIVTMGDYQQNASPGGYSGYTSTHMVIMLSTWNMASISQCLIGCSGGEYGDSLGNAGRGLWHIAAGYNQKFSDTLSGEANIGYLAATKIYQFDKDGGRDKDMATEFNATVTYAMYKNLKLSLTGAYLIAGDFLRDLPAAPGDPINSKFEDAWTSYVRVNYTY